MAILDLSLDVLPFLELTADDGFDNVEAVREMVEEYVKAYCDRSFESTTYKEFYDDDGSGIIMLNQRPITSITRVAVDSRVGVSIYNTNDVTSALVKVSSTGVDVDYDGTTASFTFATNATLSTMVAAINAGGNGWVATVGDSSLNSYKSEELVEAFFKEAINDTTVELDIPSQSRVDYELNTSRGVIYLKGAYPYYDIDYNRGCAVSGQLSHRYSRNLNVNRIYIKYVAGYSAALMPEDLKKAMLMLIKSWYSKLTNNETGLKSLSIAGMTKNFEGIGNASLPMETRVVFDKYKEISV